MSNESNTDVTFIALLAHITGFAQHGRERTWEAWSCRGASAAIIDIHVVNYFLYANIFNPKPYHYSSWCIIFPTNANIYQWLGGQPEFQRKTWRSCSTSSSWLANSMEICLWEMALVRFYCVGRHGFAIFYQRLNGPPLSGFAHTVSSFSSAVSVHHPNCVTSASPTLHIPQFMTITHQSNHRGFFFNRLTIMMCFGPRWISTVISSNPPSFLSNPNDMIYFSGFPPLAPF